MRLLLVLFLCTLLLPKAAEAEGVRLSGDWNYAASEFKTKDSAGVTNSSARSNAFLQRYTLSLNRTLYPHLVLSGGGIFENSLSDFSSGGVETSNDASRLSPHIDLSLRTPFISSGAGYRRTEDRSETGGRVSPTFVTETYLADLGLTPEGFPSLKLLYTRRTAFDEGRISQNIQSDGFLWSSGYAGFQDLELNYSGSFTSVVNKLNSLESQSLGNNARVAYTRALFGGRASFATSYNASMTESRSVSSGQVGELFLETTPFPLNALLATTPSFNPPVTVTSGRLTNTADLLSGNARINIVTPAGAPPPTVETQLNMGLSFAVPTTFNTLFIQVISGSNLTPLNVAQLSGQFSWDVYTSSDGTSWNFVQTIANAPFGRDPSAPGSDSVGFILGLSLPGPTQFIKVVVTPRQLTGIPPEGVNLESILVTRLRAFERVQAGTFRERTTSSIGGLYDLSFRAQLLENPDLSYDMGFSLIHSKGDQTSLTAQYSLVNGLSLNHRFSRVFSGSARVSAEYFADAQGQQRGAVSQSVSLTATPIPALNHSLSYSGGRTFSEGKSSVTDSFFVNNTAQLYKGISVNLSGGISNGTAATGQKTFSTILTSGAGLQPHRKLSLNVSFLNSTTKQTGGGLPDSSSSISAGTLSTTCSPFEALYLTGTLSIARSQGSKATTSQSYGLNWSPFRGGALQFNFNYGETAASGTRSRNLAPALRWDIRPGASLDLTYQRQTITRPTGSEEASSINSSLRITL